MYTSTHMSDNGLMKCKSLFQAQLASAVEGRAGRVVSSMIAATMLVGGLIGCSATPSKPDEARPAAAVSEPLGEYLARAQALEASEASREQARQVYRAAAKAYPADKRPWLRLAQSYFDARDYGNAVLAAEEAAQRDSSDVTAQSLLAVSGLRISTAALSVLRSPSQMTSSTRQEAEGMAQNLRSILGEPVLVPRPLEVEPDQRGKAAVRPRAKTRAIVQPGTPTPATTAPKPAAPSSPFGALK